MRRSHSVLVVDDDDGVRAVVADALAESGHVVSVAVDGDEAIRRLSAGPLPCVVLADVRMPRMDGFELSRAMGRDPQLSTVPIVVFTGDKLLTFTTPARDKPLSVGELDALVQRSCRLHRPRSDDGEAGPLAEVG